MRSLIFALALAAPVSAVAAAPNYSNPMSTLHQEEKQQVVYITFVNSTFQDREIRIGNMQYDMRPSQTFRLLVAVGSVVRVYSDRNSKVSGQPLIQVSANDADKSVFLK
jgi:hypothetical protein